MMSDGMDMTDGWINDDSTNGNDNDGSSCREDGGGGYGGPTR